MSVLFPCTRKDKIGHDYSVDIFIQDDVNDLFFH